MTSDQLQKYNWAKDMLGNLENYSRELIKVYAPDYKFVWNNNKTRWGFCDPYKKIISMSGGLILLNLNQFNDTLRHEVAHAITPINSPSHGYDWRINAYKLGATPKSCQEIEVKPQFKYELVCNNCGKVIQRRHKAMSERRMQTRHTFCCKTRFHQRPATKVEQNLEMIDFQELNLPQINVG